MNLPKIHMQFVNLYQTIVVKIKNTQFNIGGNKSTQLWEINHVYGTKLSDLNKI